MQKVKEVLEEVSLLVVMLDPTDQSSVDMFVSSLSDLLHAAQSANLTELSTAAQNLIDQQNSIDGSSFIELANDFISKAQGHLENPNISLENSESGDSEWGDDLGDNLDQELSVEFVEKHTGLMEDFEAHILELLNGEVDEESAKAFFKAYLHNVKGDAGSVGFIGIQNITHKVEDLVISQPAREIVEQLLAYREWVAQIMKCYTDGKVPDALSHDFENQHLNSNPEQPKTEESNDVQQPEVSEVLDQSSSEVTKQLIDEVVETVSKNSFEETTYEISGDVDILVDFLVEAEEHLTTVEELLLSKEDGYVLEDLEAIFRAVHSIKGGSSYFGLKEITRTSHNVENLMDGARKEEIIFNNALKRIILEYIDLQRNLLSNTQEAMESGESLVTTQVASDFDYSISDLLTALKYIRAAKGEVLEEEFVPDTPPQPPVTKSKANNPSSTEETATSSQANETVQATDTNKANSETSTNQKTKTKEKIQVKDFVKVDTTRLDKLLEYIGEMVISSSMLIKSCRDYLGADEQVMSNTHQLERISREIQEIGMSMRLVPIKGLFQKMSRVVWDTARKLDKDIHFEMEGAETELDRSVIDGLTDPLMHMVRNAVDHGIESQEERVAAGKPAQGTVKLSAYHSAGTIMIEIEDDGKGLDSEALIAKAKSQGIISESENLSNEDAYMLIFAAGFSTAKQITDVSGRGVGMDVVRRNLEAMRGRVRIESELGKGSRFIIELPLTLAIMEGVETSVGDESFIIPSLSIVEFLKPTPDMIMHTLEKGETLKFRGMFLPIFRLSDVYNIPRAEQNLCDAITLVVENGGQLVALLVDSVHGKISTVIKSLGTMFKDIKGLSGCAIMPDGSIGLILDIPTIVELARESRTNQNIDKESLPSSTTLERVAATGQPIN